MGVAAVASAGLVSLAACGGNGGTLSLPPNVSEFLHFAYAGSNAAAYSTNSVAHIVESMTGEQAYYGSNTLPGTASISGPNAQGAVLFTWIVRGQRFQWWVAQNGQYAVPTNARSRQALGG